jgi:hypothetical protein
MAEFFDLQIRLKHVLDIHAYDHVLFLTAFCSISKDWKRLPGHTVAYFL